MAPPQCHFAPLKMFLAHASKLKSRVKQLDFIGAFLQAKVRSRIFVTIPNIFGMFLSSKYWYLEMKELLESEGFVPTNNVKCLFIKHFPDKTGLLLLNYVDDMLYICNNDIHVATFE
jgi:hypothetical protein